MKISQKITFVSTSLYAAVFLLVSGIIYISFYNSSNQIFYDELARTAKISGMFYLEKDELSKQDYKPIEESFYNLSSDQQISIYDEKDQIAFDTKTQDADLASKLNKIRQKGALNFKEGDDYYHGLFYIDNQGDFVVLVKAQSELIQNQLRDLLTILLIAFLAGMLILIALTSWLSKLAYRPVRNTIRQVNTLDLNKSPLKLEFKSTGDELEGLVNSFNGLLQEIEQTYRQQKNFVDYASHELKTPLTTMINRLEVNLQRVRKKQEYEETEQTVLKEALRLQNILRNLLTFSSINRVTHQKTKLRIDELIWNVLDKLSVHYERNRFKINLHISSENFDVLEFKGNETLLQMAFYNLMENAAKFSGNKRIDIILTRQNGRLHLSIRDQGIGTNQVDLGKIIQPFYRADNAGDFKGSGLGLGIAKRILELHQIDFSIQSKKEKGTTVVLTF